jgi:amino acid adenylation domain-containing protein
MIEHFENLLTSVLDDPARCISRLPMLSAAERAALIAGPNQAFESRPRPNSLHERFEAQVARTPGAVAVTDADGELTYFELNCRSNQLAHYLRSLGVGRESLVGIYVERTKEMIVGLLGILKAGGAYVPLDPAYPPDRLGFVLNDAGIRALITQTSLLTRLPDHQAKVIRLDSDWGQAQVRREENPEDRAGPDNLAYVIYTSGSTGRPKGALVTHSHVMRLFAATESWFGFQPQDVWTLFHSCAFDFSVWEIWGALLYGGRLVVTPYLVSRSPQSFYQLLGREQVTVLNQTPSAFRQLMQVDEDQQGGSGLALRLVIFGGEALDPAALKPWVSRHGYDLPRLVNMYGITETTVHVTYRPLVEDDVVKNAGSFIGAPIPDLRLYLLDRRAEPAPLQVAGEMFVGGAGVSRGYLNRPELTAAAFVPDLFSVRPGARLYRTGDAGSRLPSGDIRYLGRIEQQVKIRGFRIELGEIEENLIAHEKVRDAVAVARDSGSGEKQLVAYVVPCSGQAPSVAELRGSLEQKLPSYMLPAHFVMLDKFPLTANGKIDRLGLPEPGGRGLISKPHLSIRPRRSRRPWRGSGPTSCRWSVWASTTTFSYWVAIRSSAFGSHQRPENRGSICRSSRPSNIRRSVRSPKRSAPTKRILSRRRMSHSVWSRMKTGGACRRTWKTPIPWPCYRPA